MPVRLPSPLASQPHASPSGAVQPDAWIPAEPLPLGSQPLQPFLPPDGCDPRLEAFLQQGLDLFCRWSRGAAARSPLPPLSALTPVEPAPEGLSPATLLTDLQLVMDGAYNPHHPGALAHLDPPPLAASLLGELVCAGLNNNLLAEELSPSLTRLERCLCGWMAERLGLPGGSGGVGASGGSLSNLMALVVARQERGLQGRADAVLLASADAHVSLSKALMVMGLPPSALQPIPVDDQGCLDPDALDRRLGHLARSGIPVLAVVATAGTTVRGAIDPLPAMAALCRRHGLWLHVDGAIGAVFGLSDSHRALVAGLGRADSITINPQKLLGITKTSSLLLLRDPAALARCFSTGLPYMEPSWGGNHGGEVGLQGSRPAEVLKLWLGLRQLGLSGIEALLEGALGRRRQLEGLLRPEEGLELVSGPLHLLAFRPRGADPALCARWSERTRQRLLGEQLMLSRPLYGGSHHLKAVLGNPHTSGAHLERLAAVVAASLADGSSLTESEPCHGRTPQHG